MSDDPAALPHEVLVERARALETVLLIAREMTLGGSIEDLAARFVKAVAAYTRFPAVVVLRFMPAQDEFEMLAQRGFDESKVQFSGRALVMDDDDHVRIIAVQMLERLGFEVDAARHGLEALALARSASSEGRPHRVALLDLTVVGGLGGAEIADELRLVAPGIRLVVASGYADRGHEGWDARLHKPYRLLALSRSLAAALIELPSD